MTTGNSILSGRRVQATDKAIARDAARWVAREALGTLDADERARLAAWLAADSAHRLAHERVAGALLATDGAGMVAREAHRRALAAERGRRQGAGAALGAALLLLAGAATRIDPAALLADRHTGRGELRALALADGSRLVLDAGSAVDMDYDARGRTVRLVRGRVHVQVAHGDPRPFRVAAAGGAARDVGTAFDVALAAGGAELVVTEGLVMAESGGAARPVAAGRGARWRDGGVPVRFTAADAVRAAAWRHGRLVFEARPLGEVIATLDRYSTRPLWLWNRAAAARRVSGVVRSAEVDASLPSLAGAQGLRLRDLGVGIILY